MRLALITASLCGCLASWATAADLNVSVRSGKLNAIMVSPGADVTYEVLGVLSDMNNEGLALFAFDLEFDGGPLTPALAPTEAPLNHFATNLGINNPAGFGGTPISGRLVQVGGGQNTIKNTVDHAPYPIGDVVTGVGHATETLVVGTLTAPTQPGDYTLTLTNLIANVIKAGETAEEEFWEVEPAGAGSVEVLLIQVVDDQPIQIIESVPPNNAIDARRPTDIDGENPAGWATIALTFTGDSSALTSADFSVASTSGSAPNIVAVVTDGSTATIELDGAIPTGAWTTFSHTASGSAARIGYLPADVDNNGTSGALDILALIDGLNGVTTLSEYQSDVDRSGSTVPLDILGVIDLLNGAGEFDAWNGVTLPE